MAIISTYFHTNGKPRAAYAQYLMVDMHHQASVSSIVLMVIVQWKELNVAVIIATVSLFRKPRVGITARISDILTDNLYLYPFPLK